MNGIISDDHSLPPGLLREPVERDSWEYAEADTQQYTHGLHRYSGKFIPQIAARAIRTLTAPGELVVDPYCGSGTTLLEAALAGRRGVGIDLNPLAVLVAGAKVTVVEGRVLDEARHRLRAAARALDTTTRRGLFAPSEDDQRLLAAADEDPRGRDPWFTKWFQGDVLRELLVLRHAIDAIPDEAARNVALVAFSEVLRRSSNAHSGYPNVMFDKNAPKKGPVSSDFLRSFERAAEMVGSLAGVGPGLRDIDVRRGDARALPIESESVDAVVSHPPYIGSVPYAEYGALSLKWLGFEPRELDSELTGGRRQAPDVVERFRRDYGRMLAESARVLRKGRVAFIMVGHPTVRGEVVDLQAMTLDLASQAGLHLVAKTTRAGVNRRANKMGAESLLFLQKR